ncbi:ATP-dependent DNA ligase [Humisphaera borealis]|uniref:DNA ligase n=1 Tax=Humisphaera borealis TaxID=2807512 RepID=A0A7M2WRW4_9BACT|nr:ATP-dependent DNA ligase [Humisphaera borealis]QOV88257.1 ATP-dependent DNA ligase [Humisphaera borealis]
MTSTLQHFATVNDAAAATSKKLQKQAILADYFRGLPEDDLRLAVRFAAGRAFASTDARVLNVGWAVVGEAILAILSLAPAELRKLSIAAGEVGEAIAKVWETSRTRPPPGGDGLTLRNVAAGFDEIARLGMRQNKLAAVHDLFRHAATGREAAYLAKIIFGDLRTGVQEGVLQAAVAAAFDAPLAKIQRVQLLIGDLEEVAVLARRQDLDSATFTLFHPIQFMLAAPQETPADAAATLAGRSFVAEDKLDGIRAQIHKSGQGVAAKVAIYTRTLDRVDESFPDVVRQIETIAGDFLLDGEIVPYRDGQVLPFGQLQKRLGRKSPPAAILRQNPCAFIAFDILFRDGSLLMDEPLAARRAQLDALCGGTAVPILAQVPVVTESQITTAFTASRDRRNEGIILKDSAGPYAPGRRGGLWFKLKTHLPTLDCVVTAAETGHGKRRNSLSDYTFAVWNDEAANTSEDSADGPAPQSHWPLELVNVGKAYSGVTDDEIAQLTALFTEITTSTDGRVRQVRPQVVLEIAFDQIQRSDRHASGFALRFPRIKRIRWDKRPEDADRLSRVTELYESISNFAKPTSEPSPTPAEPTLFDGM